MKRSKKPSSTPAPMPPPEAKPHEPSPIEWVYINHFGHISGMAADAGEHTIAADIDALWPDEFKPTTPEEVEAIKDAFRAIPLDQQRRILNGWRPPANFPKSVAPELPGYGLMITAIHSHAIMAYLGWYPTDNRNCQLLIPMGNTRETVLRFLHLAIDRVRSDFESMIDGMDDEGKRRAERNAEATKDGAK